MMLASYREHTRSAGHIEVLRDIETDVRGRDILLVDDILESAAPRLCQGPACCPRRPARFVAALLDKQGHRAADIEADFLGFPCPDVFVVGYGDGHGACLSRAAFVGHLRKRAQ